MTKMLQRMLRLSDEARSMGIHLQAGKGSGKSWFMARIIAWLDFIRRVPQVVLDPVGTTIDYFVGKVASLPKEEQERLWSRVLYVDMSGKGSHVVPFPLYYQLGEEGPYAIAQRFLDVVRKLDPFLHTASVEGWNPLWRAGTNLGMVLAALKRQITEAEHLLRHPETVRPLLRQAVAAYPEVQPAVQFFEELAEAKEDIRRRRTESFLNKAALFTLEPTMRAMFGAGTPGIDWQQVINRRMTIRTRFGFFDSGKPEGGREKKPSQPPAYPDTPPHY